MPLWTWRSTTWVTSTAARHVKDRWRSLPCTCFDRSHQLLMLLIRYNASRDCCICVMCPVAAAVVCQQGIWRTDRHWATVSQSLVHSPSLPQLWPLLCRFTRHDKGEGTVSFCVFSFNTTCFVFVHLSPWNTGFSASLLPGVLWYLASVNGRASTLLRPGHSWWQGTSPAIIYLTLLKTYYYQHCF